MTQEIVQEEMPFAMVRGEVVTAPPKDLYIPPEAMEVFLDTFEGPLIDELLKEQNTLIERAQPYVNDPSLVRNIISDGCEHAREVAEETMREVRQNMGLDWN